jgi:hypothetical protein
MEAKSMEVKYKIETFNFDKIKSYIKIPTFQRSVVWSEDKKQNFIDTVLNGLPFGSLLLYKENPTEYLLVDGLQRYTTLCDFENNPYKYIKFEEFCKEKVNAIIDELKCSSNTNFTEVKVQIIESIKHNISFNSDVTTIVDKIISEVPLLNCNSCYRTLFGLITDINKIFNISAVEIPLICYYGNYDELPLIFERMNANGTQLSKYEIYAAKWSNIQFEYHDTEILQLVDEKYQGMIDKTGVEICNYQEGQIIKEQKINLFEFCFAFGKLIHTRFCAIIFDKKEFNTSDVASIGFTLLTVILTGSIGNMNSVSKYFQNMDSKKIKNLTILKEKILECINTVQRILDKYITLPTKTVVTKYIEHQMICIIATLFKIRYQINVENFHIKENPNTNKINNTFVSNMPMRYLYDIISGYWSGSGDSKISEELSKNITDNRYLTTITASSWEQLLYDWMSEQTQKPMKKIPIENKLFLSYLFTMTGSQDKYLKTNKLFDFEYIIAKDRFQKSFKDGYALSAIGNICILPRFETRSKQEYTLYESIDTRSTMFDIKEDALNDFLYPEREEINFIRNDFTYSNYLSFIKNRQQYLINTFKNNL